MRLEIFAKKNKDYGSSYDVDGVVGIVIRLGDKLKRLKNITRQGHQIAVEDEGLKDLLLDIGNYCDIGLMLLQRNEDERKTVNDSCDQSLKLQQGKVDIVEPAYLGPTYPPIGK